MQSKPVEITCIYCQAKYIAGNENRTHCQRTSCRAREIQKQLKQLESFIDLFCTNNIKATIEFRLPGNDKLKPEAKIDSTSILGNEFKTKTDFQTGGIDIKELISYFETLLWKRIKGNIIVNVLEDRKIESKLLSQTFTKIANPIIIGNNLIVTGQLNKKRR